MMKKNTKDIKKKKIWQYSTSRLATILQNILMKYTIQACLSWTETHYANLLEKTYIGVYVCLNQHVC